MEWRTFADRSIDLIGEAGCIQWVDIYFHGDGEDAFRVGKLPQQGLASDDDKFVLISDIGTGTDDVF